MVEKSTMEIYQHYGMENDRKALESGELPSVDFLIGKEEDIKDLTSDMAGFGTGQSQRVTIEYDKGYGYFIVKRMPMQYGVSEETPTVSDS